MKPNVKEVCVCVCVCVIVCRPFWWTVRISLFADAIAATGCTPCPAIPELAARFVALK